MLAGRAPRVVISVGRGASAGMGFHYSSRKPDALPTQIRANVASAAFECIIASAAGNSMPARISLYGHGLLGSHSEIEAGNVQAMATEHSMVFCATDWWGLASTDVGYDVTALQNLNGFPTSSTASNRAYSTRSISDG